MGEVVKLNFKNRLLCLATIVSLYILICAGCSKPTELKKVITDEVSVELKTDKSATAEDLVLVEFNVTDGWHIYGAVPQKNGRPTTAEIMADDKALANLVWPKTVSFDEGLSGLSEGYAGKFAVSAVLDKMPSELSSRITWVACKNICVPGEAVLNLQLR